MRSSSRYAALIANGRVANHYQPITDLRTGVLLGLEVLGRLQEKDRLLPPGDFLPGMDTAQLEALLFASLPMGLELLAALLADHYGGLFMSFNVSPAVMQRPGFAVRLVDLVNAAGIPPGGVTLEILESDEFRDLDGAQALLAQLTAGGISLALDDVGTGYSSLARMRSLPVDKVKLDQGFVRGLSSRPEKLHFVASLVSLARGLRKTLVVEGVETPEIMQALGVMGVIAAQGYAIARPMPRAALHAWLAGYVPTPIQRGCDTLLSAYANHLAIVEACRALQNAPLPIIWDDRVNDPHACIIGQFFERAGLHDTACGRAHRHFHSIITRYSEDPVAWEAATDRLWRALQQAIREEAAGQAAPGLAQPPPQTAVRLAEPVSQ
jgi:EAL domain-containing protein (putative c-di-GMP-specific phosphodiesterase class I)